MIQTVKQNKKAVLAFLLALVMLIGLIPFTATEAHAMTVDATGDVVWEAGDSFTLHLVSKDNIDATETHTVTYDGTDWSTPKSDILPAYAFAYIGEVNDIAYSGGEWSYTPVLQLDQSNAEKLTNADVMIATGEASKEDPLDLHFKHYYAKVTYNVVLASEFNSATDTISRFDAVTCDGDYVNPYVDGNSYTAVIPANPYFKAGVHFALVTINGKKLEVEIPDEYANPNGSFVAGTHYTFDLKVGKDKVEIETITVNGNFPGGWDNEVNLGDTTGTIGTPDKGKTAWEDGDYIVVDFTSHKYGNHWRGVKYGDSLWTGTLPTYQLPYLENETPTVSAIYSPYYGLDEFGAIVAGDLNGSDGIGKRLGECEFIEVGCTLSGETITVDFSNATRNYSRIRIAAQPGRTLRVGVTNFTSAGSTNVAANGFYQLVADADGNAFLYGTFGAGGSISVHDGDNYIDGGYAKLADYIFGETTEAGKSYALDAHAHVYGENGSCNICGKRKITTITFDTDGGSAVAPITQECGTAVTAPANPTRNGYNFIGWSPALPTTMPTEDITVKALWKEAGYTIVWKSWDGTVLMTNYNVAEGTIPSLGYTPTRPSDSQYVYEFIGWTPAVTAVTGDATYTATYKATLISEYTYKVGDRVVASADTISYCASCGRLLKNYTATITGVRGVLDGKTIYWITRECCGHKSSMIETDIIGLA